MGLILKIAGAVFLGLVLFFVLAFFYIRRKLRKFAKELGQEDLTPSTIHLLEEDPEADWLKKEIIQKAVQRLTRSGFLPGRAYSIQEMTGVRLIPVFHAQSGVCAVVYDHDTVGTWIDLAVEFQDGEELTVTNAPMGEEIDHRPECIKVYKPGAGLDELVSELKKHFKSKPIKKLDADSFKDRFEEAYAKDMAWRNERGGVSLEEIRKVAEREGRTLTPEELAQAHQALKSQEISRWHREGLENFRISTSMSVKEWTDYDERGEFVLLTDRADPRAFLDYLGQYWELEESEIRQAQASMGSEETVKDLFQRFNDQAPEGRKAEKVGAVDHPVQAEIYFIPDDSE